MKSLTNTITALVIVLTQAGCGGLGQPCSPIGDKCDKGLTCNEQNTCIEEKGLFQKLGGKVDELAKEAKKALE